jgi:bacillithiol biosynthesis cysteine-adding enzyme BshC
VSDPVVEDARDAFPPDALTASLFTGASPAKEHLPPLPRDDAAWAAQASAARAVRVPSAMAEALAVEQRRLRAGPLAERNARALGEGAVAVVAGQQPGLFGGPLLALHKAMGAVALARRLDGFGGVRVVPVFWIASEDHDLAECNRATLIDALGAERSFSLQGLDGAGRSVHDVPVPSAAAAALKQAVLQALPATDRARAAVDAAWPDLPDGTDLGARFAAAMAAWLGDSGLVFVEPHALAPWAGPVFARLVEEARPIREAILASGARLAAAGVTAPLQPAPGCLPLFAREEPGGPRARVFDEPEASGEPARVRAQGWPAALERDAFVRFVRAEPRCASGDVVGRVFLQDLLLPVLAQVAGPTETAYLAQVRAAFEAVGARFPVVAPRPSATWVDAKSLETVRAFGTTVGAVLAGREPPPPPATDADDAEAREWKDVRARLEALAGAEDAAAGGVARALRKAVEALDDAMGQRARARDEKRGLGRARWAKAKSSLLPGGKPQERVLSPLSIAARQGVDAVRAGAGVLAPLHAVHQLIVSAKEGNSTA